MADDNETLEQPASDETSLEQPSTDQAVESTASEATGSTVETTETTPEPKLFAGKYKTVEELENAYRNTSSEASRMSQQLAAASKPAKSEPDKAAPTTVELESWKEGHLVQISRAQAAAQKAYQDGDYTKAQQYDEQATASARQIRLIDAELRKQEIASYTQSVTKRGAEERILNESRNVLNQYKDELVPGTELYTKASEFMASYEAMGHDPNNLLVQAQAVSIAAQLLGLSSKKVEVTTRKELSQKISQALKQGTVTGGGKAAKTGAPTDFTKMSKAEFLAYKKSRGWD
jgi:hypothetical protein